MKQKKIMILGASQLQLPAITRAIELGYHVIVVDKDIDAVGRNFADEFYAISTNDIESVVAKAKELHIDGIMTLATDFPMRTVAMVGQELGLLTITPDTAIVATDKARMRERLKSCGVPIPAFYTANSFLEYKSACKAIDGKKIVKPADSSGSRGVYLLTDINEIEKAYKYSKSYSRSGELVIEEYMKGPEVSVETITINNITHVIAITDKQTSGSPYFVEIGHSIQSTLHEDIKEEIKDIAIKAVNALGIDNGAAHVEVIVTDHGAKVVELGARLGGDNITSHLVPLATGVNMVEACIFLALGGIPDITPKFNRSSAIKFISSTNGKIKSIDGVENVKKIKGIIEVCITKGEGDVVNELTNSSDRIGFIIAEADTAKQAMDICEKAVRKISINLDR
ncbi:ATP-grasp domain-containing protein [Paenibacillus sp. HJGM_3]|uniref:ATP-grasp domain-containing protein n=1 Tax=Paenibacillus sp. HJGM_3 TaxID=3379816 RepID=UPI00385D16FB